MVGDCAPGKAILGVERGVQVRGERVPVISGQAEMGVVFLQRFMLGEAIM